jgi:hypothetical protein
MNMKANSVLNICFTGPQQQIAVVNKQAHPDKFCEIFLFINYVIRQVNYVGIKKPGIQRLMDEFSGVFSERIKLWTIVMRKNGYGVGGVSPSYNNKSILAQLTWDPLDVRDFSFQTKANGFGLLDRGLGSYVPASILVLARYLLENRINDGQYYSSLAYAATQCGRLFEEGDKLSSDREKSAVMRIALEACDYEDCQDNEEPFFYNKPKGALLSNKEVISGEDFGKLIAAFASKIVFENTAKHFDIQEESLSREDEGYCQSEKLVLIFWILSRLMADINFLGKSSVMRELGSFYCQILGVSQNMNKSEELLNSLRFKYFIYTTSVAGGATAVVKRFVRNAYGARKVLDPEIELRISREIETMETVLKKDFIDVYEIG